jgi:hypothetical protein
MPARRPITAYWSETALPLSSDASRRGAPTAGPSDADTGSDLSLFPAVATFGMGSRMGRGVITSVQSYLDQPCCVPTRSLFRTPLFLFVIFSFRISFFSPVVPSLAVTFLLHLLTSSFLIVVSLLPFINCFRSVFFPVFLLSLCSSFLIHFCYLLSSFFTFSFFPYFLWYFFLP